MSTYRPEVSEMPFRMSDFEVLGKQLRSENVAGKRLPLPEYVPAPVPDPVYSVPAPQPRPEPVVPARAEAAPPRIGKLSLQHGDRSAMVEGSEELLSAVLATFKQNSVADSSMPANASEQQHAVESPQELSPEAEVKLSGAQLGSIAEQLKAHSEAGKSVQAAYLEKLQKNLTDSQWRQLKDYLTELSSAATEDDGGFEAEPAPTLENAEEPSEQAYENEEPVDSVRPARQNSRSSKKGVMRRFKRFVVKTAAVSALAGTLGGVLAYGAGDYFCGTEEKSRDNVMYCALARTAQSRVLDAAPFLKPIKEMVAKK